MGRAVQGSLYWYYYTIKYQYCQEKVGILFCKSTNILDQKKDPEAG